MKQVKCKNPQCQANVPYDRLSDAYVCKKCGLIDTNSLKPYEINKYVEFKRFLKYVLSDDVEVLESFMENMKEYIQTKKEQEKSKEKEESKKKVGRPKSKKQGAK